MPDKKISDLTSAGTLTGAEQVPIVQSGSTVKTLLNTIKTFITNSLNLQVVTDVGNTTTNTINVGGVTTDYVQLDTASTNTNAVGKTIWNATNGTAEIGLLGGTINAKIAQDLYARVVNKTTTNLLKSQYKVVKVSTAQGQRLAVDFAQANNDNNSADTIGLVAENISNNQEGFIITVGQINEINTTGSLQSETWADGDVLYLSPTTAGAITNIKPTGLTGHIVVLGYIEYAHAIHGKIYVKVMNGWELDELHNVYINPSTLANNDVLTYESSTSLWKNKQINFLPTLSKDITDSATLTGTTAITLMKSVLIPANTFTTNDIVKILNRAIRSTATGAATDYLYINATNSLTGATLIGIAQGTFSFFGMERSLYIKSSTNSETINSSGGAAGSEVAAGTNGSSSLNINWTTNQYIIAAFQNAAVGNSTVMSSLIIQKF